MKDKEKKELNSTLKLLAESSIIVLFGIILSKVFSYLYRIIIARSFGPEVYGLFTLSLMIIGLITALFLLGLNQGLLRFIPIYRGRNQKQKIKFLFQETQKILLYSSIIAGAILFLLSEFISITIFHNENLTIFLQTFAFLIPFSIFATLYLNILQSYEKIGWYSFIFNILQNGIKVLALAILIFLGLKTNAVIFSYFLGIFIMFLTAYIVVRKNIPEIFSKYEIKNKKQIRKDLWKYSWPLIFWDVIIVALYWLDSFVIGYFLDASSVGIYNAAVPIALLLGLAPGIFIKLFFPLINKEFGKGNKQVIKQISKQVGKWIFFINIPTIILILLFPELIIRILFGENFTQASTSLMILSIGAFFTALFTISHSLISMTGKSKTILFDIVFILAINLTLNIILVPIYGIEGAAFSTAFSNVLLGLIFLYQGKRFTSVSPLKKEMITIFFAALIPGIIIYFTKNTFTQNTLTITLEIAFLILAYSALVLTLKTLDKNDFLVLKGIRSKLRR